MNRTTIRRLSRLETVTSDRDARVHVIPAATDDEFEAKRADLVTAGEVGPRDLVIHVRQFSEPEPQCWGSLNALMERTASDGRKEVDFALTSLP